jgi:phosphoribosyl-ATP pyrophosphohydrolase
LLAQLDIPLEDIQAELTRRFGTSGLQEKAARTDPQPKPNQP